MSVDEHTNGHGAELTSTVTFEDLDEGQRDRYPTVVEEGARYLNNGALLLEQMEPTTLLEDHEEPDESFVERFRKDVDERADELEPTGRDRRECREERQGTTTDPEEIDWAALWNNCGVEPQQPLSGTQLALAVDVSKQTPVTDDGATNLINRAVDAGVLRYYERKQRYAPNMGVEQ